MTLQSATFYLEDYKGRNYKVHAISNTEDSLWCMVYRATDNGYEEDYYTDFCLHAEECPNLNDEMEVENTLANNFNDELWVYENIGD